MNNTSGRKLPWYGSVTPQWDSSWETVCPVVYNTTLRGGREEKRVRVLSTVSIRRLEGGKGGGDSQTI